MAPERTAAPAAVGSAAAQSPSAPKEGPVGMARRLMQGLRADNAEQAAGLVASFDLTTPAAADGVAAEMYSTACSSADKADAVAALLAALLAADRNGNGRPLRRLLLTRCEKAFELTPPPGMSSAHRAKLGAVGFVTSLFRAGVVPAAVIKGCLSELLEPRPGRRPPPHDLECAHVLLAGAGQKLDGSSDDNRRAVDTYCRVLSSMLSQGVLKQQPELEGSLRSLLALRATGWQRPAVDAAADALASQLTLSELAASSAAPTAAPPAPAPMPAPQPAVQPAHAAPAAAAPTPVAAVPAPSSPAALMPDEWDYLAPGGVGVFGPFSMEQLHYWVAQGHLEAGVQVKPHSTASGWWDLHTAARCLATGQPLPVAALTPAPLAVPVPGSLPPAPGAPLPGPRPGPPPANLNGGSGAWVGHATPVQQMASFQQESWPSLGGEPVPISSAAARPTSFATPAQPHPSAPSVAPAPVQPQPTTQPPAAAFPPAQQAQHTEVPDAGGWAEVPARKVPAARAAPTAPLAVPRPGQQAGSGSLSRAYSNGAVSSAGSSPAGSLGRASSGGWSSAGGVKAGGGGAGSRKSKSVGYEDEKVWLVRTVRGHTSGPFTGAELLDMLNNETLAESSQVKKSDWKAYRPLEEVEDVILEMYSKKPPAATKPQPPAATAPPAGRRRPSDLENYGSGGRKSYAHSSPNNAGWQLRAVHAVAAEAAGQSPRRAAAGLGRSRQAGAADAAWEEEAVRSPVAAQVPLDDSQPASPAHQEWGGHAEPAVGTPLPGTPGGAAPPAPAPAHWEDAVPEWPALGTPAASIFGPDGPAVATPPSARYTPGPAGMADGLLAGFTPSPGGIGATGAIQPKQAAWASPAGWGASPASSAGGASPAGTAHQAAPMAGGPQVPAGPKAAFASWAAAGAAKRAAASSQAAGSTSSASNASAASASQAQRGASAAAPARSRQAKQACIACGASAACYLWVPCGHFEACAACPKPAACSTCGQDGQYFRVWS